MIEPKVGDFWRTTCGFDVALNKQINPFWWEAIPTSDNAPSTLIGKLIGVRVEDLDQLIERDGLRDQALWETLPYEDCPKEWHEMLKTTEQVVEWKVDDIPWKACAYNGKIVKPEMHAQHIYRITDLKREPEEQPKPLFKLFEIDWTATRPFIQHPETTSWSPGTVGLHIHGYRIFGFTDDAHWSTVHAILVPGQYSHYNYETQPCDHTGNRKYAIGRLEESK